MQYINKALHHLVDHRYILAPTTLVALDDEKTTATIQTSDEQMKIQAKLLWPLMVLIPVFDNYVVWPPKLKIMISTPLLRILV